MKLPQKFLIGFKALRQLGVRQVWLYGLYQLGLRTGHYQRTLTAALNRLNYLTHPSHFALQPVLSPPAREDLLAILGDHIGILTQQADEIIQGKVRLFGGQPVQLELNPDIPLKDWSDYEQGSYQLADRDIKFTWEPGRFGWACTLAMAYYLSKKEQYAQTFWDYTQHFINSNPPYFGPHWSSAQEVAIRLVALTFAYQFFIQSNYTTSERKKYFARIIAIHAERIPPTLVYARSQNNNHLISEALGLYTASALLPEHPLASGWYKLGLKWLLYSFSNQIDTDGTYIQHSTNYHRLMLQAALWFYSVKNYAFKHEPIPSVVIERLSAAAYWLCSLIDPETGCVPNLGHNDGAYILPLSVCPYNDYRPVAHAACQAFTSTKLTTEGPWQDMSMWLSPPSSGPDDKDWHKTWHEAAAKENPTSQAPFTLHDPVHNSWAMLHVASFHSRPAHADQLHLDLWWRGLNITQDAGTYLYNTASPWDNSLTNTMVHNTIMIDDQESMLHAGRFLYLDWAQAEVIPHQSVIENEEISLTAQHDGYRKFGIIHTRRVTINHDGNWVIVDQLIGPADHTHTVRLHWLLPDWQYEIHQAPAATDFPDYRLRILSPYGWITLEMGMVTPASSNQLSQQPQIKLIRAGRLLYGIGEVNPISGWSSPTYGEKIPALACILMVTQSIPIALQSLWILPHET
jgi:hypothetical protein